MAVTAHTTRRTLFGVAAGAAATACTTLAHAEKAWLARAGMYRQDADYVRLCTLVRDETLSDEAFTLADQEHDALETSILAAPCADPAGARAKLRVALDRLESDGPSVWSDEADRVALRQVIAYLERA